MNKDLASKQPFSLRNTQRRIEGAFYLFGALFLCLALRLAWLQAMPLRAASLALPDKTFERRDVLPARRGQILAADGTALAVTLDEFTISANPRAWNAAQKDKVAGTLVNTIGGDASKYRAMLDKTTRADGSKNFYVRLARHVDEGRMEKLKLVMGPQKGETRAQRRERKTFWEPLSVEASPRRHYPLGDLAPQLIGFSQPSGVGVDGLEKAEDKFLGGTPGIMDSLVDARGRAVPGTVKRWKEPVDGQTVVTTIDPKIQAATDATMKATWEKYRPNFCVAVVMKPSTGEIVAVSTAPGFDLNHRPQNIVDLATNRAFSYAYEPGSTFKIITASAAVETVPDWESKKFLITGSESIGKHTLHDWQFWSGRAKTDVKGLSEGIRDSSNICMYHFARLMPRDTLLQYSHRFGIGDELPLTGFNIHPGVLPRNKPSEWSTAQLANFSFGQGMMITPLQLARIGGVIANGGVLMKPILIKEIRDSRGQLLQAAKPEVERLAIQQSTAEAVKKMMLRVVEEGTARKFIFVPGYRTAGKTGSAQKADGPRGYSAGKFISSFIGFLPADKPRYVIAVMADEPHGSHWGSEVCGPAFTNIAQAAMVQMRLEEGTSAPAPDPARMERPKLAKAH